MNNLRFLADVHISPLTVAALKLIISSKFIDMFQIL